MGMTVAQALLVAIYPIATAQEAIHQDLAALEAANFLVAADSSSTWTFAQVIFCRYLPIQTGKNTYALKPHPFPRATAGVMYDWPVIIHQGDD